MLVNVAVPFKPSFETTIFQSNLHSVNLKHVNSLMIAIQKLKTREIIDDHTSKVENRRIHWWSHSKKLRTQELIDDRTSKVESTRTHWWSQFKNWEHENWLMITIQKLKTREFIDDRTSTIENTKIHWWLHTKKLKTREFIDDCTSTVENTKIYWSSHSKKLKNTKIQLTRQILE